MNGWDLLRHRLLSALVPEVPGSAHGRLSDLLGGPEGPESEDGQMASWEGRTKTITRHEWAVPVGPYGTDYEELGKACDAANRFVADEHQRTSIRYPVRVFVGVDEIVFRVEVEKLERPTPLYRDARGEETQILPKVSGPPEPPEPPEPSHG